MKQVILGGSGGSSLILTQSEDGDITVNVGTAFSQSVRFCTVAGGGVGTTRTRKALLNLMDAMIEDGAEVRA